MQFVLWKDLGIIDDFKNRFWYKAFILSLCPFHESHFLWCNCFHCLIFCLGLLLPLCLSVTLAIVTHHSFPPSLLSCFLGLSSFSTVPHGPLEPPGGQGELERSGDPHSDNGSNSPTWERDQRGPPLGPPQGPLRPPGPIGPPGECVRKRHSEKKCLFFTESDNHRPNLVVRSPVF